MYQQTVVSRGYILSQQNVYSYHGIGRTTRRHSRSYSLCNVLQAFLKGKTQCAARWIITDVGRLDEEDRE